MATLLGFLLTPVLLLATPGTASAWSSVTANPANMAILAEAAAMEGGTISAAGSAATASTATRGAAAAALRATGAVTKTGGEKTGFSLFQRGAAFTALFASVGGLFGLTLSKDDPDTTGGGVQGWSPSNVVQRPAYWDNQIGQGYTNSVALTIRPEGSEWGVYGTVTRLESGVGSDVGTAKPIGHLMYCSGPGGVSASNGGSGKYYQNSGAEQWFGNVGCGSSAPTPDHLDVTIDGAVVARYDFNPRHAVFWTWNIDVRCRPSGGGDVASITRSGQFLPDKLLEPLDLPDVECASGSVLVESHGWLDDPTTTPVKDVVLWDYTAPQWVPDLADAAPDCFKGTACTLTLKRTMPDGSVRDCFASPGLCTDWIPKQKAGSTEYSCWFGPYRQPISRCYAYPNPGLAPAVPTVKPDGTPITDPGVDTPPDTGDTPVPGSAGNPTDAEGARCFPTGWGMLNPVEWVYKPVKCALVWAFVPSISTVQQIDGLAPSLMSRTPFPQMESAVGWLKPPAAGARCWDLHVGFPAASHLPTDVAVLNSCDRSNPVVAWLLDHRGVLSAIIWFSVLAPFAWWFWRQYAPGASGVA